MERSVTRSLIVRVEDLRAGDPREDLLAVEEPLEIQLGYERRGWRVHKSVSITMRTPGADAELAAGFLFTEGIVTDAAQIEAIHAASGQRRPRRTASRRPRRSAAAGAAFLHHVELRRVRQGVHRRARTSAARNCPPPTDPSSTPRRSTACPPPCASTQAVFDQTGGLHAAALFDPPAACSTCARTWAATTPWTNSSAANCSAGETPPFAGRLLFVSGRASFELVQKALAAGIPILAAVGAPSSLAVELAQAHGMTLLGFVRGGRFNIYTGEARIRVPRRPIP